MVEENSKFQKKNIIEKPPKIFPKLTKQVLNLDELIDSESSIKKLGSYGISLNNLTKKSIYKKLLDGKKDINMNFQKKKEIRNIFLKKLVESNSFFFPKELGLEECKKPINIKEVNYSKLLKHLEEKAKKEKLSLSSRKSTLNINASRKESLLDNKRKRTDSIYEELNSKKKKKSKKEKGKDKEENGEERDKEDNDGEVSYYEDENYGIPDDDDSQNYNYSEDDGRYDDGDY